ncbi:MAG TPA: IPTL-CTERM sorting domain-containing protein, partial [Thermoanaerobaculia bacterium]
MREPFLSRSFTMNVWKSVRARIAFALLLGIVGLAPAASAATSQFNIYLNSDNNQNSGCDVSTVDGLFQGAEHVLVTTVETTGASSANVTRIERRVCADETTNTFGPLILVDDTDRPVGIGNGTDGFNVVETYFPLSILGNSKPPVIRLAATSSNGGEAQDAVLTAQPNTGQPILLNLQQLIEIPTLSEWGIILLALLLASAALTTLRRRSAVALLMALALLGAAGLVWAATSDLDGNTLGEWTGAQLATDPAGDAPVGLDIRAFFGTADPTNIYFRLDVSLSFNAAPTATDDTATVIEDSGANTINVLANDSDPDGDPFTIGSVTQPANGTVAITNSGADLTYTPNANYCNNPPGTTPDTFTYTLTPGGDTATVAVTVTCVDDNPTAVNDAASVQEGAPATAIDVLANDTDVDGGPKSISSVTQPANGMVVITGGGTGLTYQPNANYCNNPPGTTLDTFTYTLT